MRLFVVLLAFAVAASSSTSAAAAADIPLNDPTLGLALPPADTRAAQAAHAALRAAGVPLIYRAEASVVHCNDRGLDKKGPECAAFDARYREWAATLANNPAFEAIVRLQLPVAFDADAAAAYCAARTLGAEECTLFTTDYQAWSAQVAAGAPHTQDEL